MQHTRLCVKVTQLCFDSVHVAFLLTSTYLLFWLLQGQEEGGLHLYLFT